MCNTPKDGLAVAFLQEITIGQKVMPYGFHFMNRFEEKFIVKDLELRGVFCGLSPINTIRKVEVRKN